MPNIDATLDALVELRRLVPADKWNPREVRRRPAKRGEQGEYELVLVNPRTGRIRPRAPMVRFRPTFTDHTRVTKLTRARRV